MPFWLGNSTDFYGEGSWTEYDTERARVMNAYLVNFCMTGDPNATGLPTWEPYTTSGGGYLHFDEEISMQKILKNTGKEGG